MCYEIFKLHDVKTIVNLFSYEKKYLISAQKYLSHDLLLEKSLLFNNTFFVLQYHFCFCFTLEVESVLFFLMMSCLHKKLQTK